MKVKINGVIRNLTPITGSVETLQKYKTKSRSKPVMFEGQRYASLKDLRISKNLSGRDIKTKRERGEVVYL